MTKAEWNEMSGAEQLRLIVSNMNCSAEQFNERFTAEQLLKIGKALVLSDWDIYPEYWTLRQLREAIKGKPPKFDDNERPVYK